MARDTPEAQDGSPLARPRQAVAGTRRSARCRRAVESLILVLTAGLAGRTWFLQGLVVPLEISSGSMAETLLGPHCDVTCGDCARHFSCGLDWRPTSAIAVCPNCGYRGNAWEAQPRVSGDRVLIHRSIFCLRPPRRWEVVAFRRADGAGRIYVKRVVGLPGESVQVRDGKVFIDGRLQPKTLPEQRAVAILVHDADCVPRSGSSSASRWIPESGNTGWTIRDGIFAHGNSLQKGETDWIGFRHYVRIPGTHEGLETPIGNEVSYNQTRSQRGTSRTPASDLLLSLHAMKLGAQTALLIRATGQSGEFLVEINGGGAGWSVSANGRIVSESDPSDHTAVASLRGQTDVELSLFDRQFLLALDGKVVSTIPLEGAGGRLGPVGHPFSIGVRGSGVEIRHVRIYHDTYYERPTGPRSWGVESPVRLNDDEFYLLGDNSSISEDSRTWPEGPGISLGQIIGKPLLVHFPARQVNWGGWHFQVPDLAKIRYIR